MHKGAARSHRIRHEFVKEWGALYDRLLDRLHLADPMVLGPERPRDEYEPELQAVLPRIPGCSSAREVQRALHEEFGRLYTPVPVPPVSAFFVLSVQVWEDWRLRNSPPRSHPAPPS